MRIMPPAGVQWSAALWTAQVNQTLYYTATNGKGPPDTPVRPASPPVRPTEPPAPGSHRVDLRV